jgi:phage terminase large subunit GpA-like protein
VHLPRAVEVEWVKQLVAEQLRTSKDRRGFARQEWSKLRERNEALDCAVLARAALWLLGADRYGERFWQRLREELADAPIATAATPTNSEASATPDQAHSVLAPLAPGNAPTMRPRTWLSARSGWLR